jgi:hypothetical protein
MPQLAPRPQDRPRNDAARKQAQRHAIRQREAGRPQLRLQAALKLAKLYQSTGHPAEAHDILAPALEGFSSTPEMPVIAKAQALLGTLA